MRLTENFLLPELCVTNTGLPNNPTSGDKRNLLFLASFILQPIRDRWGRIRVTSGYRSQEVNDHIGGSPTSQHTRGEAADIIPLEADLTDVFKWFVEDARIAYGQAIKEKGVWIHVSLPRYGTTNNDALIYDGESYEKWRGH